MKKSLGTSIFSAGAKNFRPDRETFSRSDSSIPVQLVMRLFLARFRKKPRGGSRGVVTRSLSGR